MFIDSDNEKRYHTYDSYLKHTYGTKCAKIPLDGGFSCPNRENGSGGCTYCSARGSGDFCASNPSLAEQFRTEYAHLSAKWGKRLPAIPYFQAFSGTYAPLDTLKKRYEQIFSFTDENGSPVPLASLSIATRPDCLPPEVVSYLSELNQRIPLTIELGLQSMHEETLQRIHRGHDRHCFETAFSALREVGIAVCVHIIDGLPGETPEKMLETAAYLGKLKPEFLKIHMLHILRGTPMADEYLRGDIPLLTREEYIEVVCRQITMLSPETVLCRLTGDGAQNDLIAPEWTKNKRAVLNGIDRYLREHDLWQGCAIDRPEIS